MSKAVTLHRYVDDIFVVFKKPEHVEQFHSYMNTKHNSLSFTFEKEDNGSLSFLDVKVSRENNSFITAIFRKSTFSGVYTNFRSFLPFEYKTNVVMTLLFRLFTLSFNWSTFHQEIRKLKDIFRRNGFPKSIIDRCVRNFLQKCLQQKLPVHTVPKKEFFIILPYLGVNSLRLNTMLTKTFQTNIPFANLKVIFRSSCRMRSFFRYKDNIPLDYMSQVIYKFVCNTCNSVYIGKTPRHYGVRKCEHLTISAFTRKPVDRTSQVRTSVELHGLSEGHVNTEDSISLMAFAPKSRYDVKLRTQESILIKKQDPNLNRQITSIPLVLF